MIHDFVTSNGSSGELTVRRGQTVEVLERLHDKPDWCLVRTTDHSPAQEGIVPCSMLCIAHSRSSVEMEGLFNHKGRRRMLPWIYQVHWKLSHQRPHDTSGGAKRMYFLFAIKALMTHRTFFLTQQLLGEARSVNVFLQLPA